MEPLETAVKNLSDEALITAIKALENKEMLALLEIEMVKRGLAAHLIGGDGKVLLFCRTMPYPNKVQAAMEEEQTGAS